MKMMLLGRFLKTAGWIRSSGGFAYANPFFVLDGECREQMIVAPARHGGTRMKRRERLWRWCIGLSITGIILAAYLFYNFLTKPPVEVCYITSRINCDAVTKGSLATIFGVPVSQIGLIGYIIILFSSIIKNRRLLLYMSAFGMLFCVFITYQEVFILSVICPVCLACQFAMFAIFILSLVLNFDRRLSR